MFQNGARDSMFVLLHHHKLLLTTNNSGKNKPCLCHIETRILNSQLHIPWMFRIIGLSYQYIVLPVVPWPKSCCVHESTVQNVQVLHELFSADVSCFALEIFGQLGKIINYISGWRQNL